MLQNAIWVFLFFKIAIIYAIDAIETAFIVFLDHENVGLHI